jgi:membrane fusion protein, multidrug efflux system
MNKWSYLLIPILAMSVAACGQKAQQATPPPPPQVDVAVPLKHKITEWDEFTGRFEALARVDIRARVTGYLVEQRFRDGQFVKQGDVLFVIDPRPFEYDMRRAEAQYTLSKKSFERATNLRKSQSVAQEVLDERWQQFKAAEASLNEARLNLEFTQVKAPIDGKISNSFVDTGNLVSANDTVLTRIVTIDPIHFVLEGSQADLLKYTRLDRAGKRPSSDTNPNPIFIKLLDEESFLHKGRMDFVDNIVDPGTGTITARALVENKQGIIYPGFFGRAHLLGTGEYEAILLPEKAINTDQNKRFVYTVNADNQAVRVYVTPGPVLENGFVIVREGLNGDERVVINGAQRIRTQQQPVTPVAVTLEWQELPDLPDIDTVPSLEEIAGKSTTDSAP